jgi:hypothetical protein
MSETPKRRIERFLHCANCAPKKPANQSMSEWVRIDAGLTADGFQVWCKRCRMEIVHFTPEGLEYLLEQKPGCDCCPGGKHVRQ